MSNQNKKQGVNIADLASKMAKSDTPLIKQPVKAPRKPQKADKVLLHTNTPLAKTKARKGKDTSDLIDDIEKPLNNPNASAKIHFIHWIAMPEGNRMPSTQKEFAKQFKVDEDTLTNWKKDLKFWKAVDVVINRNWREKTSQVLQAMYVNIIKNGNAKEVGLFLQ